MWTAASSALAAYPARPTSVSAQFVTGGGTITPNRGRPGRTPHTVHDHPEDREAAARPFIPSATRTQPGEPLQLQLGGEFARGGVLTAHVRTSVAFASLPFVGRFGTIELSGRASAPVDRYRSLLTGSSP